MKTMVGKFNKLKALGFDTPKNTVVEVENMEKFYDDIGKDRKDLDYDIDGIVFSVNNLEELEELGIFEDRNKPKGQIALKFPAEGSIVEIKDIFYSYEGGQSINMVAIFDGVEIGGAIIRKASMKSHRWVVENGVGIGSVVEIKRSGDIIPKIEKVISNENFIGYDFPEECEICGAEVVVDGAQLICDNFDCPAKEAYRINRFLGVRKVKGLGHKSLLNYARKGVRVIDFVAQDFEGIERKIFPSESRKIWSKIRGQLE